MSPCLFPLFTGNTTLWSRHKLVSCPTWGRGWERGKESAISSPSTWVKPPRCCRHFSANSPIHLGAYINLSEFLNNFQAFEELLRANDIDYYMGQSFREQLAQSTALAHRVVTKISGRKKPLPVSSVTQKYSFTDSSVFFLIVVSLCFSVAFVCTGDRAESHNDKMSHELLAVRWVNCVVSACWMYVWKNTILTTSEIHYAHLQSKRAHIQ